MTVSFLVADGDVGDLAVSNGPNDCLRCFVLDADVADHVMQDLLVDMSLMPCV